MTEADAKSLTGELKGLMPMLTLDQGRAVVAALTQRDSVEDCRNAIRAYACDYEQFSLATFIDRLPPRPGSNEPAWDRIAYEKNRAEREAIARQQDADRAVCNQLSDASFETIARQQIALFDDEVRTLSVYGAGRTAEQLRRSNYLTSLVAAHARAHGLTRNRVMEAI